MFIPLHDAVELKYIRVQYVTIGLIALDVLVWLFTTLTSPDVAEHTSLGLGFIPAVIFGYAVLDPSLAIVPDDATFITYSFLHLDFWHLASNMLFLWVFGDNVEDALGHIKFLIFYLICAAAGAALHGFVGPSSEGPLIGASGAISGVVAAYFLLHPRVRVWVLVLFRIPLPLPAFIPLTLWIVQQFAMLALDLDGMVSWGAHVGGIIAGGILVIFMRRKGVPLFDRTIVTPKAVRTEPAANAAIAVAEPGSNPR
ncbi:rhomboid family intramembrane serine protease [Neorhizobium alkalisoli]|uniref:rhomboid family intramembrane serine protease n=1 Tax=Neorhizobium alkalisoli TaxID=528178 RepID=UPI000CF97463|nr:rhomboid family intramembrane serine protease [Neorhizobium alkalisoli]